MKTRLLTVSFVTISFVTALVLAGCSSGPGSSGGAGAPTPPPGGSTPPSTSTAAPTTSASGSSGPASSSTPTHAQRSVDAKGHGVTGWVTPSGNISCALLAAGSGSAVRCDIAKASWKGPKKPKSCQFEWGTSVQLHGGKPSFACVSDPVLYAAQVGEDGAWWYHSGGPTVSRQGDEFAVLAYGDTMRLGTIRCTSERTSLTCTDTHTKHGFHYAEQAYTFF